MPEIAMPENALPENAMPHSDFDFRASLNAAPDPLAAFALVQTALEHHAVREFSYGALTKTGQADRPVSIDLFHASLDTDILAKLGGKRRYERDLTSLRAVHGLDTDWTDDGIWLQANAAQRAQSDREMDMGFTTGYTHVLGQIGGCTMAVGVGMQDMSAQDFARHWPQLSQQILPILRAMDGYFHAQKPAGARRPIEAYYALSPRERDVLSWLALGLRPDEIATTLGVGYRTVDKYIVSARQKLGARTRDHAVARAIAFGLIAP